MTFKEYNQLDADSALQELLKCCGSMRWAMEMRVLRPFEDIESLIDKAGQFWIENCGKKDYLEAFGHHPRIGDTESLREKYASTATWAGKEQEGVTLADEKVLQNLKEKNDLYFDRFGYIFIVCATGKSAHEMLSLLENRLDNTPEAELLIARNEQQKITELRLNKLFEEENTPSQKHMSQITTHILDTSLGKPAEGVEIELQEFVNGKWVCLSKGITDADGRIKDLLSGSQKLIPGKSYQMYFHTEQYFSQQDVKSIYPYVIVAFQTLDHSHYHIPLLLNPFGYSTYRGS